VRAGSRRSSGTGQTLGEPTRVDIAQQHHAAIDDKRPPSTRRSLLAANRWQGKRQKVIFVHGGVRSVIGDDPSRQQNHARIQRLTYTANPKSCVVNKPGYTESEIAETWSKGF